MTMDGSTSGRLSEKARIGKLADEQRDSQCTIFNARGMFRARRCAGALLGSCRRASRTADTILAAVEGQRQRHS